jgi:hypothetical protein
MACIYVNATIFIKDNSNLCQDGHTIAQSKQVLKK